MKKLFQYLLLLCFGFSANAQYNSLLWKISGNGLKEPSYLYGTMHTKDARVFAFADSVLPVFKKSKVYAMELDPEKSFNLGLIPKLMMGKGHSLKKMLPEKEYNTLDTIVKKAIGVPVFMLDNVAPVFTMTILEIAGLELSDSSIKGNDEALDLYFHSMAKKQKKKIIGIETVDEQIDALNALSYEEQAELLLKEIQSFSENKTEGIEMVKFYTEQTLDSLAAMSTDEGMPEKLYKALVTDRNMRMANRMAGFMKEHSTFVAVGALHLPGEKGVIELLRKKGFTVEAVR